MNREVEHSFCFEAGHACTTDSISACSFPHGHSFVLIVRRRVQELQADNDTAVAIIQKMLDVSFQHKWLNVTLCSNNTDLEYISEWIVNFLRDKIVGLSEIVIYNSADHCVSKKFN